MNAYTPSSEEFAIENLGAENMPGEQSAQSLEQLVFVGFNSRIVALDRDTGELCWEWKSPKGTGFVAVLLDGDRLIASVQGYTYCLDPFSGATLWSNPLKGMGTGVPCIATYRGTTSSALYALLAQAQQTEQAAAAAAGAGATGS